MLLFILLCGGAAAFSHYDRFAIDTVAIAGLERIDEGDVRTLVDEHLKGSYWHLFAKRNIALYPRDALATALSARFPRIDTLSLDREWPRTLSLYITEREPAYLWCEEVPREDTQCFFADRGGVVFAEAPRFSGGVFFEFRAPLLAEGDALGNQILSPLEFQKLVLLKDALTNIGIPVVWVYAGEEQYEMGVRNSGRIIFSPEQDIQEIVTNLTTVLTEVSFDETLDYLDLRFGDRVYYKEAEED